MRSEQSWSLIDPKPIILYIAKCDEYIVYWNGIVMPHKMALAMSMERACSIYSTPEMKRAMEHDYEKLYYSGAFETRAWDQRVENSSLYDYLKRVMKDHLDKVMENRDPKEVLSWFNYNRARKEIQ